MNQSQISLVNPSNPLNIECRECGQKDSLMMSGFGSYYLNLVSITFYTIPTSIFFQRKSFLNSSLVSFRSAYSIN